ncbi:MAG TPA: ice-binding family protein [Polyangiaceae bacterium]
MRSSTFFVRHLLIAALPSFALLANACADNDSLDTPSNAGAAGAAGSKGGAAGKAGSTGSSGAAGKGSSAGDAGEGGASDSSGAAGTGGAAGISGAAGRGGSSGAAGKGGAAGTSGTAGNGGSSGAAGKGGAAGTSSSAGNGGSSGAAGKGGAAGTSGSAGNGGSSGAAGSGGSSGAAGKGGAAGSAGSGGSGNDVTAPTAQSSVPASGAINVGTGSAIRVTFSEAMDPSTLTTASFSVKLGNNAVAGTVSYFQKTATFTPNSPLAQNSHYDVAVSVAAKDLAGNALATPYASSFNTALIAALGPAPVGLGTSGNFAVLAQSTVTNVPTSAITGNLGLSPAAASYITGFTPTKVGAYWTSAQVVGGIFAADNDAPTPNDLTTAVANMQAAYTDAAGRPTPDFSNFAGGSIGGLTLVPGLYKWASSVTIPADVALVGAANDVWIFQITGDLTLSSAKAMALSGGGQAKNVFWQVAGAVNLGTTSHAEGIMLCKTAIVLGTGASINGRLLAQTAVNLASNAVTEPAP